MAGDYAVLAPIYETIGMANFATQMTPRLLEFAQQNDWLGRRIIDIGCGTGNSVSWLTERSYSVTGVDYATEMLQQAHQTLQAKGLNATLIENDIRSLDVGDVFDLVFALDVLNEIDSVRELEAVFSGAYKVLNKNRFFVFDLHTLQGLAQSGDDGDTIIHDDDELVTFSRTSYDYERQTHRTRYDVFKKEGEHWQRQVAQRMRRAYPIQAIASLLRRQKFEIVTVVDANLSPFDISTSTAPRVIFLAKKI